MVHGAKKSFHLKTLTVALSPSLGTLWPCGNPSSVTWPPCVPSPMTTLPQPLFSPLTWDVGPAHFTDGVTRVQRGGGWMGPEPTAQVPMWVLCLAGPAEAWSWQAHQLLCRGLGQQLCVLRTP